MKKITFCDSGKISYETAPQAWAVVPSISATERNMMVYKCGICNQFHISYSRHRTSNPKRESSNMRKPSRMKLVAKYHNNNNTSFCF